MVRIPSATQRRRSGAPPRRARTAGRRAAATTPTRELVELRDGAEVTVRRITPADAPVIAAAFARLSEESRRLRFLGPKPTLTRAELRYLTEVDGHDHEALGAIDPRTGEGVAIGRFVRDHADPSRAEVAITVADRWQHRGLGKLMLERLADRARAEGIIRFTALVAEDNENMRRLLERIEAPAAVTEIGADVAEWEIRLAPAGLGAELEGALRAAASGHLQVPPRIREALRALMPLHLHRH
jgi:RimJ/RimL family protein N-acetyltransferase